MVSLPKEQHLTQPQLAPDTQLFNKYKYEEFAGYSGERLFESIVKAILPTALGRTALAALSYQAPGRSCYVGTQRIAEHEKPGLRKIEMDIQQLRELGLLRVSVEPMPLIENGKKSHRLVPVKNFNALFDLAHKYYLWTHDEHFVPCQQDYKEYILERPELAAQLSIFDNYRRLLYNKKTGPKRGKHCSQSPFAAEGTANNTSYQEQNPNNKYVPCSPYRNDDKAITEFDNNSSRSTLTKRDEEMPACSPQSLQEVSYSQQETQESNTPAVGYMIHNQPNGNTTFNQSNNDTAIPNVEVHQGAKQASVDNTVNSLLATQEQEIEKRLQEIRSQVERERVELVNNKRRHHHPKSHSHYSGELCNLIDHLGHSLGDDDDKVRSNMTWLLDRYQHSGLAKEIFMEVVYIAYAQSWKQTNVRARNKSGKTNRMPVFRAILKKELGKAEYSGDCVNATEVDEVVVAMPIYPHVEKQTSIEQRCETPGLVVASCETIAYSEIVDDVVNDSSEGWSTLDQAQEAATVLAGALGQNACIYEVCSLPGGCYGVVLTYNDDGSSWTFTCDEHVSWCLQELAAAVNSGEVECGSQLDTSVGVVPAHGSNADLSACREGEETMAIKHTHYQYPFEEDAPVIERIEQSNSTLVGEESRRIKQGNTNAVQAQEVEQSNETKPTPEMYRHMKVAEAIKALRNIVPIGTSLWTRPSGGECYKCKSPIATAGGKCPVCNPPAGWSAPRLAEINAIIARIPTMDQARAAVERDTGE